MRRKLNRKERWALGLGAGGGAVLLVIVVAVLAGNGNVQEAFHGEEEAQRLAAVDELARDDSSEATHALQKLSRDENLNVAARAVYSLARSRRRDDHADEIAAAARDRRPRVRETAVTGMEFFGEAADLGLLSRKLGTDPSPRVRAAAARTIGRLEAWSLFDALLDAMDDRSAIVRGQAGSAVKRMAGRDYRFRADLPRRKRRAIISQIRRDKPGLHQAYLQYQRRKGG